jgi:threonine synthase
MILFRSTRGGCPPVSASQAVKAGLAPDGGLYVPVSFPALSPSALTPDLSFAHRAIEVLTPFFVGDPAETCLPDICRRAFHFPIPLRVRPDGGAILELFHGPTSAFKDVGARFLAEFLDTFPPATAQPWTILVATSGDTGGAVAAAFHRKTRARVAVFFPKDGVSARQRAQLTCWDENIVSYAVDGTFDDCQRIVKTAFTLPEVTGTNQLTSANSINLGRLLPQAVYYVDAAVRYRQMHGKHPDFIIPTGNAGNATAAFWAKEMGAPIGRIILAANANRPIVDFLASGDWRPRPSIATLANAMDVGNPSNLERLRDLFHDLTAFRRATQAHSVGDEEIRTMIRQTAQADGTILCPHTAVAEVVRRADPGLRSAIIVATAHPAKFETIVEPLVGGPIPLPPPLANLLRRPCLVRSIPADPLALPWARLFSEPSGDSDQ